MFEGPTRRVGPQAISEHRDHVRTHPRIGREVAVAEEVGPVVDLNDRDCAQPADRFELIGSEQRRVDASEPRDAADEPAGGCKGLVVGRNLDGDLEPG
mgnify:CR=1 FL=1